MPWWFPLAGIVALVVLVAAIAALIVISLEKDLEGY